MMIAIHHEKILRPRFFAKVLFKDVFLGRHMYGATLTDMWRIHSDFATTFNGL